jgi:hypothetical protein
MVDNQLTFWLLLQALLSDELVQTELLRCTLEFGLSNPTSPIHSLQFGCLKMHNGISSNWSNHRVGAKHPIYRGWICINRCRMNDKSHPSKQCHVTCGKYHLRVIFVRFKYRHFSNSCLELMACLLWIHCTSSAPVSSDSVQEDFPDGA